MPFAPSTYQQAIFDWVSNGSGHAVVEAVAGSGKTTTAVKAMELMQGARGVLFLAFNKSIADELSRRIPSHCEARTLNSLGHRAVVKAFGRSPVLDSRKVWNLIKDLGLPQAQQMLLGGYVSRLVSLGKAHGVSPYALETPVGCLPSSAKTWTDLIARFDLDIPDGHAGTVIELTEQVMRSSFETAREVIDFDDQIYLPLVMGLTPPRYDWVIVDEAQDLSLIQHSLAKSALAPGGRMLAIGDSRQAIYGFRGASSESMARLTEDLQAVKLPLSICYRCPKSHIELAQKIVPQIESSPSAAEGVVSDLGTAWGAESFQASDIIICRSTAPLIRAAYSLIAQGLPCKVLGRDIGSGLTALIKKLNPKGLDQLQVKLDAWYNKEMAKAQADDKPTQGIQDKADCLQAIMDNSRATTIPMLVQEIETLFADKGQGTLTLSTVHKAKGLEAPRTFILDAHLLGRASIGKKALARWQFEQEKNLEYVALTRAKETLAFIDSPKRNAYN